MRILILLTVFILGLGCLQKEPKTMENCNAEEDQYRRDVCVWDLALSTNERKYCKEIVDKGWRSSCYQNFERTLQDPSE